MDQRKQNEDALRDSEARYRRLFETAKDGILLLDADSGQITDVNPFIAELLGYTPIELLGKKLWEIGPFKDVVASQAAFRELQLKKYIRYEELPLETKKGERVEVEFVSNLYKVNHKKVIQCNIRDISERMQTKINLRKVNVELSVLVVELQKHDRDMRLINRMNVMLQACTTQEEAYQIIALAVGELFTDLSGGLAILSDSGQHLETCAHWGIEPMLEPIFSLHDCWAMRRGQKYEGADPQINGTCGHFISPQKTGYLCLPLVVQGETLGLMTLEIPAGMSHRHAIRWRQLVEMVGEDIKISLSNLKLREIMREQVTHDSLTGLFNRCYLEDTLPREINHSIQRNAPICIARLDIDNFKHFTDTFGHEAGNIILCELGKLLHENVRESDIACRFQGEEFVLVLLDSPLEASYLQLEKICTLFKKSKIWYSDQLLGPVTLSVGLVEASKDCLNAEGILRAADDALLAAKRTGRDRVVTYNDLIEKPDVKKVFLFQDYTRLEPNA